MKTKIGWPSFFLYLLFTFVLVQCKSQSDADVVSRSDNAVVSLLGKTFYPGEPSDEALKNFKLAEADFEKAPKDIDRLIWYGRRTAYLGRYEDAIAIYSKGLDEYPSDARLYRHRGHRYISIRQYDKAIADLKTAADLIEGTADKVEPDGLPNKLNIPLSTLHGNIWYHLGLAYYLKHDFEQAKVAYEKSLATGKRDDNIVSDTHWLYMINRRLGDTEAAEQSLESIHNDMNVIENTSYYDLCRFYKGLIPRDSLLNEEGSPSGDALAYGLANWDFYEANQVDAQRGLERILNKGNWASFGFLAAEKDYLESFASPS